MVRRKFAERNKSVTGCLRRRTTITNNKMNNFTGDRSVHYGIIYDNETLTGIDFDAVELDCPIFRQKDDEILDNVSYVVEGVIKTAICLGGLLGNTVAALILLSRKQMRNAFNLLLVSLTCFDSLYLIGAILDSFRGVLSMASQVHIILFPYFLYPMNQMAINCSVFMTVAISVDRYRLIRITATAKIYV